MNRTLLLLIAVLLLGGVAWWATRTAPTATAPAEARAEERRFGLTDLNSIGRIFVADRKGHQVNLTRGGVSGWLADGRPANENVMSNVLDAVRSLDVRSLPAQAAKPHMIEDLATNGILVQIFDRNDQKLRGYYLGSGSADERGTNAIVEGSEEPYFVHLPHFSGNVRLRFSHWDDEWRDKVYWRVDPERVESFSIDYPRQRNKSFKLTRQDGKFRLAPFYDTGQPSREVPRSSVESALARYEKYYINSYQNGDVASSAQAREVLPFATIRIKQEGQPEQSMVVYPRYADRTFTHDPKTGDVLTAGGLASYQAFINDGEDWVLMNVETTGPLFVGYGSF